MNKLEKKIIESFIKVKNDIVRLQSDISILTQNQDKIIEWMTDAKDREYKLYEKLKELRESIQQKITKKRKK